jgi:hypothetical protein
VSRPTEGSRIRMSAMSALNCSSLVSLIVPPS